MTPIYLDLLDTERKKIFLKLKFLKNLGVLAGGTALCLQIKHRYSVDFDIFFDKDIIQKAFSLTKKNIPIKKIVFKRAHHITFLTPEKIRITLFHYSFPPLYPKIKTSSISLYNLKDIALDKAYTIGRRPVWRDYVDLFFLLKDKYVNLEMLLEKTKKKFGIEFIPKLFLQQLVYYDDIENFKVELIGKQYARKEIEKFLQNKIRQYVKQKLEL